MRRASRIDNTATALRAYAESLGFLVLPINGVIDAALQYGERTWLKAEREQERRQELHRVMQVTHDLSKRGPTGFDRGGKVA